MMKNIIENKKLLFGILAVVVVGLMIGFIYCIFFRPVGYPRLRVITEIARTQFQVQVGELISVKPHLINMGRRPITIFTYGDPFFIKVYDMDNRQILLLPEIEERPIQKKSPLNPGVPHIEMFTFALDQPGRYKVVAWTEFSFDAGYAYLLRMRVYANPIWIWVGEYYGSSTYGQCQRDNDCFVSGCNAEVCQSRAEEERVTICILPDKPTPKQLNYGCKCVNQKCQWSK